MLCGVGEAGQPPLHLLAPARSYTPRPRLLEAVTRSTSPQEPAATAKETPCCQSARSEAPLVAPLRSSHSALGRSLLLLPRHPPCLPQQGAPPQLRARRLLRAFAAAAPFADRALRIWACTAAGTWFHGPWPRRGVQLRPAPGRLAVSTDRGLKAARGLEFGRLEEVAS